MNMVDTNQFLKFRALGYTRLVPIIPPDAQISETSSLHRAIGKQSDPRGKAVGVKGRNGKWYGFDWLPHECDDDDPKRWDAMGAGVGIKTGNGLVLIDADTKNVESAKIIRDTLGLIIPLTSVRVGQYPKAGYVVRTDPDFRYTRIEFGERDERGYLLDRVEILSEGRQFVAHGIHPKTGKPYEWPKGIPAYDQLPFISGELLTGFLENLRNKLPAASPLVKEGATTDINQDALRGTLETVRKAVRSIPNTSASFPSRESYRDFGYAIKAALPDNAQEAFDLFEEWCERWDGGTNDPDIIASDWRRFKPPYRRGAGWLYELAEQHSHGQFTQAEVWFDQLPDEQDNPFAQVELNSPKDTYRLLTIDEIMNRPLPIWLVERHIPEKSVGFIYSEPGAGKSFLAIDIGLSVAHGLAQWQGDPIKQTDDAVVIYIAAEGSFDFGTRVRAWLKARGLSGNSSKRFYMIEQTINFMSGEDVERLLRTLRSVQPSRPVLVIVDTVSRALPGADENLQKDMTLFVRACDAVRDAFNCAVLGIHHAGKSGDMRGSTVLLGAGDFVFRLSRKKGATIGHLTCEKQKAAPDGWEEPYRFDVVHLDNGESSLVPERADMSIGPSVELTPDAAAAVLNAMSAAWDAGEPWSKAPQAKERYAIRRMVSDFGFDAEKADETLTLWEQTGLIVMEMRDGKSKIKGFKVAATSGQDVRNEGIFD